MLSGLANLDANSWCKRCAKSGSYTLTLRRPFVAERFDCVEQKPALGSHFFGSIKALQL